MFCGHSQALIILSLFITEYFKVAGGQCSVFTSSEIFWIKIFIIEVNLLWILISFTELYLKCRFLMQRYFDIQQWVHIVILTGFLA